MNIQYQADCFKVIYQMLCKFTKIPFLCLADITVDMKCGIWSN